jgi:hypothetical protein
MDEAHALYPQYGFDRHKGAYGQSKDVRPLHYTPPQFRAGTAVVLVATFELKYN